MEVSELIFSSVWKIRIMQMLGVLAIVVVMMMAAVLNGNIIRD